ncbi:MAG: Transcription termination protein NusB, partial [uncultured Actinomycetospora sp.]
GVARDAPQGLALEGPQAGARHPLRVRGTGRGRPGGARPAHRRRGRPAGVGLRRHARRGGHRPPRRDRRRHLVLLARLDDGAHAGGRPRGPADRGLRDPAPRRGARPRRDRRGHRPRAGAVDRRLAALRQRRPGGGVLGPPGHRRRAEPRSRRPPRRRRAGAGGRRAPRGL